MAMTWLRLSTKQAASNSKDQSSRFTQKVV